MIGSDIGLNVQVTLRSFAVDLFGVDVEPQFINPITFTTNRVAGEGWQYYAGTETGLTESRFGYTNGVGVEAHRDSLRFEHTLEGGVSVESALSAWIAQRYVEAFGMDRWHAVDHEFRGKVEALDSSTSQWPIFSENVVSDGSQALLRTGVVHTYTDRSLQVDVFQVHGHGRVETHYQAHVQRRFQNIQGRQSEHPLTSVLSRWRADLDDVAAVARKLIHSARPK